MSILFALKIGVFSLVRLKNILKSSKN